MQFQILENQSSYSPKIPVTHVPDTTDLSKQVGSRDSSYRPARIRVTDTDPVSLLEKVEDQAEIIDAETHERISIPLNVIYDDSTVSALEAAKEATQYGEGELTASHTYDLQPTDLETALRKLNGSIEVTGQEVLEYSLADNTLTEVLAGFVDSEGPGTEYGAQVKQLTTSESPQYTQAFEMLNQVKEEDITGLKQVLETGTGARIEEVI